MQLSVIFPSGPAVESATVGKVSLPGRSGRFMVLRNHAPIIASLEGGEILYTDEEGEHTVVISSGFCRVKDNSISIAAER